MCIRDSYEGLILTSRGYKIPKPTKNNIYIPYLKTLELLYREDSFKWKKQSKSYSRTLMLIKELILFLLIPLKKFRSPQLPRLNYFKITR